MLTSKYALLVIINAPLIMIGVIGAITSYKTSRISRRKCLVQVVFWLTLGFALLFVEPLYNVLVNHNLTDSAPMSIFDMILLTSLILLLLLIKQANEKIDMLSKKFSRMHENITIAEEQRHWDK